VNEKQIDVVGLGAATIDLITVVEHFPAKREAQQALAMAIQGGGPVATAIVTAARLGGKTAMIDSIADDWAGRLILQEFQTEGIATDTIDVQRGHTTSTSNILVSAADGARAILFLPGSAPELGFRITKHAICSAKILHLNGRHWKATLEAMDWQKSRKFAFHSMEARTASSRK
jgi:sugar/nucleoside kinase (ribokinase family)